MFILHFEGTQVNLYCFSVPEFVLSLANSSDDKSDPDENCILWHLIWVYTDCRNPFKASLSKKVNDLTPFPIFQNYCHMLAHPLSDVHCWHIMQSKWTLIREILHAFLSSADFFHFF